MKRIDRDRWLAAQRWELDLWTREARAGRRAKLRAFMTRVGLGRWAIRLLGSGDDWNRWWMERFDGYSFLPRDLGRVLELGCGPYTNVRLILQTGRKGEVVCSDPLAMRYVALRSTWLAQAYRSGLVQVDDHPAEECPFPDDSFNVVIMINVLDHVQDMHRCLSEAVRVTKPGGIFILGQDLSNEEDVARVGDDVGHPIRATHADLDAVLDPAFDPTMREVLDRAEGRNPSAHYGTYIFAGTKKERAMSAGA